MESLSEDQAKLLSRILEADQPSRLSYLFGTGFPKNRALLKPAVENWILIKSPGELRELRIEENRIAGAAGNGHWTHKRQIGDGNIYGGGGQTADDYGSTNPASGRWPANFAIIHDDECIQIGTRKVKTSDPRRADGSVNCGLGTTGIYGGVADPDAKMDKPRYCDADGTDSGGASRFFYVAKPSTAERSEGLPTGTRNVHTTVKS